MKPDLLEHLAGENIGRFPVWMMRQAGRYLPGYREIRKDHSFWEMVSTPKLAIDVSLLPLGVLPLDAVIFFSDILTPPFGMGIEIEMQESVGPVILKPFHDKAAFDVFRGFSPEKHVPFVGQALSGIRERMSPETTLLGFAGAPWTVASYLVEGKGKTHFETIKGWLARDPIGLAAALGELGEATLRYLIYQHQSGAQAVQLFDTWISEMPLAFFREHYQPILNKIFRGLEAEKIPTIYFAKRAQHLLEEMPSLAIDVLSVDELLTLSEVERLTGKALSLQGNLDPTLLLTGTEAAVRRATRELVQEARQLARPAILNLGHGILPKTPVENAKAFVEEARALWL